MNGIFEVVEQIAKGEDTRNQFKEKITSADALASEMVAFSNSDGGRIFVGVDDKSNSIVGVTQPDLHALNQMISNVASQKVIPAIHPETEVVKMPDGKLILVISIAEGLSKPYMDNNGLFWVKSGSDKRKVTSREALLRMFQNGLYLYADESPVSNLTPGDIDKSYFSEIYKKKYDDELENQELPLQDLLRNMNLTAKPGCLNLTGALCFAPRVAESCPMYIVKAVHYPGDDIDTENYIDNRNFTGKLVDVFNGTMNFILGNIPYCQAGQDVNSLATPMIPKAALEELVVNALVHRDYFISSPVRIFIFKSRMQIINPGKLPNTLSVENVIAGVSVSRNPILSSYSQYILPYRGLGNGIRRALKLYPDIRLHNDKENNQFIVEIGFHDVSAQTPLEPGFESS